MSRLSGKFLLSLVLLLMATEVNSTVSFGYCNRLQTRGRRSECLLLLHLDHHQLPTDIGGDTGVGEIGEGALHKGVGATTTCSWQGP